MVDDDLNDVQAGRSTTSLAVERATADIKMKPEFLAPAELENSEKNAKRENIIQNVQTVGQDPRSFRPRSETPIGYRDRAAPYAAAVPSPFSPTTIQRTVGNNEHKGLTEGMRSTIMGTISNSNSFSGPTLGGRGRRGSCLLSPGQQSPRGVPTPLTVGNLTSRPERPKLLHVGRGYSRYPSTTSTPGSHIGSPIPKGPFVISAQSKPSLLSGTTPSNQTDSQSYFEKRGYIDDPISEFDPYAEGEKEFVLYKNELEADDKYHLPAEDDNRIYRPKILDYLHRRAIVSCMGGVIVIGLIFLFIILPILTYFSRVYKPLGSHNHTQSDTWLFVNNNTYPLLGNVRHSLIDPDTPEGAKTRKGAFDGSTLTLVFSDEFNQDGRTFYEGDDPYWTAPNIWYGATNDLEWYDPDAVTTKDGTLQLRMDEFPNHDLQYRSGMLNSWNQFCFKGGVFEVSVSLAGPAGVPGYVTDYDFCPLPPELSENRTWCAQTV